MRLPVPRRLDSRIRAPALLENARSIRARANPFSVVAFRDGAIRADAIGARSGRASERAAARARIPSRKRESRRRSVGAPALCVLLGARRSIGIEERTFARGARGLGRLRLFVGGRRFRDSLRARGGGLRRARVGGAPGGGKERGGLRSSAGR